MKVIKNIQVVSGRAVDLAVRAAKRVGPYAAGVVATTTLALADGGGDPTTIQTQVTGGSDAFSSAYVLYAGIGAGILIVGFVVRAARKGVSLR